MMIKLKNKMSTKQLVLTILIVIVSAFFGLNNDSLNSLINLIDPVPAGYARVLEVIDGDTIKVQFGDSVERIRLIGVDTPETHHPDKAVQCFGREASDYSHRLMDGHDVRLEADPTNTNRDRYSRLLRYVYLEDGRLVNIELINQGYGFAYIGFPFQKMAEFSAAQKTARSDNKGLWSSCGFTDDNGRFSTDPV